ncbi:20724_t:CDS:2, partial [Dentiscutata erythropus]
REEAEKALFRALEIINSKNEERVDFEENRTTKRIQKEDDDKLTFDDKSETDSNDEVHFDGSKVFDPKFVLADRSHISIISSDDSSQETDDEEDIPLEESLVFASISSEIWTLPSGQTVGNIYASKIFKNTRATKNKKKLTAVEKAILRYGASNIIDLSAHMKEWGESFCPLSRSTNYTNGRKYDVRFLLASGVDVGEWEFSAKVIANKTIGDRCHSTRINQSILNGLLEYNLNNDQVKNIQVPFLQFGGTCGQLLVEDLVEDFYIVFSGPKFELPIKLKDIEKLKNTINIIKLVIKIYERTCKTIENLETFYHKFDDVFNGDYQNKPTHFKYKYIQRLWRTPKNSLCFKNNV